LVTSELSILNSKNSSFGASTQRKRIILFSSFSKTSASSPEPAQEKLNTPPSSSTLSANHSCNPEEVERNSYNMAGEHLTGYSTVYLIFLLILLFKLNSLSAIIENKSTIPLYLFIFLMIYFKITRFYT